MNQTATSSQSPIHDAGPRSGAPGVNPTTGAWGQPFRGAAIRIENLSHTYPATTQRGASSRRRGSRGAWASVSPSPPTRTQALEQVTLDVAQGEIFGVLGPNGSGKTTLFRVLATLLRPTQGSVQVFGHDALSDPQQVRRHLGVVFQMPSLDVKLTVWENLVHQGHLYGLSRGTLRNRITQWLDPLGLTESRDQRVETLSGGMRRRVELAKSLLHEPPLLLLDEPSTGLDVSARRELWTHLHRLREQRGVTIAVTTHLMDEADRCDRLAIFSQGRLIALDTPASLKARIGGDVITIEPASGVDVVAQLQEPITQRLGPWPDGGQPAVVDGKLRMEKPDGAAFVVAVTQACPGRIASISVGQPTLEDVFVQLTGQVFDR